MRVCDGCGKEIPLGTKFIRLTVEGDENVKKLGCINADFCRAECIEVWIQKRLKKVKGEECWKRSGKSEWEG